MLKNKTKISICIPTFNRCDLLEKTLKSAIFQTQKPYEIIVVDNHSTDNTREIVEKYKKYKVKYFCNRKNLGIVGNWNKCIDYATGNYISILHSDDLISSNWYEVWDKIISKNPDVDAFFSAWAFIDLNGNTTSIYIPFTKNRKFKKGKVIKEFYKKNVLSPAFSGDLILKKELYSKEKIGKFTDKLQTEADIGMYFPLMAHYSIYYTNKILFGHRTHPLQAVERGTTNKESKKAIDSAQRYFNYLTNFYKNDVVKTIGPFDVFLKKLIITYQLKTMLKGKKTFKKVNHIINKTFPKVIKPVDYYLYVFMSFEYFKRVVLGRFWALKYKNLFTKYD